VGKIDISGLEDQVSITSQEIKNIQEQFTSQLDKVTVSMDSLTAKVDTQYNELTSLIRALSETITKQNGAISGIHQEFQLSMTTLSQRLNPLTNTSTPQHSTTSMHQSWGGTET
jgi:CRISPR/Cas system CMR subunit Cmr4 (Cas7 group RAMP superfamily)